MYLVIGIFCIKHNISFWRYSSFKIFFWGPCTCLLLAWPSFSWDPKLFLLGMSSPKTNGPSAETMVLLQPLGFAICYLLSCTDLHLSLSRDASRHHALLKIVQKFHEEKINSLDIFHSFIQQMSVFTGIWRGGWSLKYNDVRYFVQFFFRAASQSLSWAVTSI